MKKSSLESAFEVLADAAGKATIAFLGLNFAIMHNFYNGRVIHLAKHAKKRRTRKKNLNRLLDHIGVSKNV